MEQVEYRVLSLGIPTGSFVKLGTKLFTNSPSWQWIWKPVAFKLLDTATNALFKLKICMGSTGFVQDITHTQKKVLEYETLFLKGESSGFFDDLQ